MKKLVGFLLICICICPLSIHAMETSAVSAILMDQDSGKILYSKNIHKAGSVASISKIMTAVVAIESGKLKDKVVIGDEVTKAYGSGIYVKQGEVLTLEDLLYGLMLRSGNDAALAIAKYVGGSVPKFVEKMNQTASKLGMEDSTFHNPNGLDEEDEGNISSAYDMAILTKYAMQKDEYRKIVKTKKYTLKTNKNTYIWYNKNKLLKTYQYTTGGKTGFTKKARRTLVSTASKDNMNLIMVTINDGNDFQDHIKSYDEAFNTYKEYDILKKGTFEVKDDTYYKDNRLYLKNNFRYPLVPGEDENITLKINLEKQRKLKNNSKVGEVKVYLGDEQIHTEPIYLSIKKETKKKGWFHLW